MAKRLYIIDSVNNSATIDGMEYTQTAILVWVSAENEDGARAHMEANSNFAGLLSVEDASPVTSPHSGLFLFTYEGAENI